MIKDRLRKKQQTKILNELNGGLTQWEKILVGIFFTTAVLALLVYVYFELK